MTSIISEEPKFMIPQQAFIKAKKFDWKIQTVVFLFSGLFIGLFLVWVLHPSSVSFFLPSNEKKVIPEEAPLKTLRRLAGDGVVFKGKAGDWIEHAIQSIVDDYDAKPDEGKILLLGDLEKDDRDGTLGALFQICHKDQKRFNQRRAERALHEVLRIRLQEDVEFKILDEALRALDKLLRPKAE